MNPIVENIMLRVKCAAYNAFADAESGMSCMSEQTEQAIAEAQAAIERAIGQGEVVGYWDGEFSKDGVATFYEVPQACRLGQKYPKLPLYDTSNPQREWVELTNEDKLTIRRLPWETPGDLIDHTEAKLREKNGGGV